MWNHSTIHDGETTNNDDLINHNGVFSIHYKRLTKLENNDVLMMTVESGSPCIGFCDSKYSPESFTSDSTFEETINGIVYIYLDNQFRRTFAHNSLCIPKIPGNNRLTWHIPCDPLRNAYSIYLRIYNGCPQFRYDDCDWVNFGDYTLETKDYYPYLYMCSHDKITSFSIIKEKPTKSAAFIGKSY